MNLQAKVLENYLNLFGQEQTLKQISAHLGIQVTRVFRIFNGYEMKISEFEKFQNALSPIEEKRAKSLITTARQGEEHLSVILNNKFREKIEMKIRLKKTLGDD